MDKTKPCYYGPMVILRHTHNRAYRLGKLNRSISRLHYAAFQLIPYHSHSSSHFTVTQIVDSKSLTALKQDNTLQAGRANDYDDTLTQEGQNLNPQGGVRAAGHAASESETAEHQVKHA